MSISILLTVRINTNFCSREVESRVRPRLYTVYSWLCTDRTAVSYKTKHLTKRFPSPPVTSIIIKMREGEVMEKWREGSIFYVKNKENCKETQIRPVVSQEEEKNGWETGTTEGTGFIQVSWVNPGPLKYTNIQHTLNTSCCVSWWTHTDFSVS